MCTEYYNKWNTLTYVGGEADGAQFHSGAGLGGDGTAGGRRSRRSDRGGDELAVQLEERPLLRSIVVIVGGARPDGDEHGTVVGNEVEC